MKIDVSETFKAPVDTVFEVFGDLEYLEDRIEGITKVEILSENKSGLGAKWRETRVMFGKEATEEMEVTQYDQPKVQVIEAASHGSEYKSTYTFTQVSEGETKVDLVFEATPVSFGAKLAGVFAPMMKGSLVKAFRADMTDLRKVIETT